MGNLVLEERPNKRLSFRPVVNGWNKNMGRRKEVYDFRRIYGVQSILSKNLFWSPFRVLWAFMGLCRYQNGL